MPEKRRTQKPFEIRPAEVIKKRKKGLHRGNCIHCGLEADKEALFDIDGVILIEKYCNNCLKRYFRR